MNPRNPLFPFGREERFEDVRSLARGGVLRPLRFTLDAPPTGESRRVFDPEVSSLVADILSDPDARALEFGRRSILALPRPTAVKTGTSNDYRDAWAVGFSDRYTVGVWMGNVDRRSMKEITARWAPGSCCAPSSPSCTGTRTRSRSF